MAEAPNNHGDNRQINNAQDFDDPAADPLENLIDGELEMQFQVELRPNYHDEFKTSTAETTNGDLLAIQHLLSKDDTVHGKFWLYVRPLSSSQVIQIRRIRFQVTNETVELIPVHPPNEILWASHKFVLAIAQVDFSANRFEILNLQVSMHCTRIDKPTYGLTFTNSTVMLSMFRLRDTFGDYFFVNKDLGLSEPVHGAVLHASSPFFRAAMNADMLERQSKTFNTDLSKTALETVVCILYFSKITNDRFETVTNDILEVMAFLHMYDIDNAENIILEWFTCTNSPAKLCFDILMMSQKFSWKTLFDVVGSKFKTYPSYVQFQAMAHVEGFSLNQVIALMETLSLANIHSHF